MIKAEAFDQNGKKLEGTQLPAAVFGGKINQQLLAQAVRVYLSNQRQGGAKAKKRSEVERTKGKWYRQKGTGRARHGARSAPIFVGGGVAHGPTGEENYKLSLPQKMRKQALISALSAKAKDGEVKVVSGLTKIGGKTKEMVELVAGVVGKKDLRVTLVLPAFLEKVVRAGRNLPNLRIVLARNLSTYEVVSGGVLLLAKEAIEGMEDKGERKTGKEKRKTENGERNVKGEKRERKNVIRKTGKAKRETK